MPDEPSWARKGLDLLLAHHSESLPIHYDAQTGGFDEGPVIADALGGYEPERLMFSRPAGSWVSVDFEDGKRYAIWKATGAVYRVEGDFLGGEAAEDPFLVPEGSPYEGPVDGV